MADKTTINEDQKQRTLAALERRFAAAKAELDINLTKVTPKHSNPSSFRRCPTLEDSGNYTFVGHVGSEDLSNSGSTYLKIPQSIDENLITPDLSNGKEGRVNNFLNQLFRNGDGSQKYLQGSRSLKIDNWVLLDNYVQGRSISTGSRFRTLRIHSKRSKKHMSLKQHKKAKTLELPKEFHKYELYRPMYEIWKNMMTQHLKKHGINHFAQYCMEMELHGALVSVVECKITSFAGVSGIMIRETAETFGIVTRDDKFRVVPKKFSVFIIQFDTWKVTLFGDKLTSRNASLDLGL